MTYAGEYSQGALLHFLLIGAALFIVFDVMGRPDAQPGGQGGLRAR